jgi:hypothetical protein
MFLRSLIAILLLVGAGFILGVAQAGNVVHLFPSLAQTVSLQCGASTQPMRCADEVQTTGWKTFHSVKLDYAFQYPSSFSINETGTGVMLTDGSGALVTLVKVQEGLSGAIDSSMEQAGWKVANRRVYALTSPYTTNDDGSVTTTYLFIRNFPQHGEGGTYDMVQATITFANASDASKIAHANGITDPDTVLNVPEQILSTFRFLENEELNPKSGGE